MENQQPSEEQKEQETEVATQPERITVSEAKVEQFKEQLKDEQNFQLAVGIGALAAIVSAVIWAAITIATEYQIGYMAVAVGFVVGYAVRYAGKGINQEFGVLGAILALVGCLLGNLFSQVGFAANYYEVGIFEVFSVLSFGAIIDIMKESFTPMDLLFYGIAVYEGYKFAFRQLTEEEINEAMQQ